MFKRILQNRLLTFFILLFIAGAGIGAFALVRFRSGSETTGEQLATGRGREPSESEENGFSKAVLTVNGLSCGSCIEDIQKALGNIDGVGNVAVNIQSKKAAVYFDPAYINDASLIADTITSAGYPMDYYLSKVAGSVLISRYVEEVLFHNDYTDSDKNRIFNEWSANLRNSADITYYDATIEALVSFSGAAGSCCN